ncbi:uncharacterized protein LOC122052935 [Zingiber officinale]|uniref:Transmembrane protein 45B n=1 Tax=Zingiber officinale TaxID=94328 RepID=A0A8J5LBT1_ZINOF|nr:uncharacterized protein LOC122052935 [Zingiber officinale]KAG6522492.1 hypothetical protein ZIOFF_019632 [Zingiber officinale]
MGTMVGHVAPGFGFLVIGLWHLFNHVRLRSVRPASYASLPWFPAGAGKLRHLELHLIALGSLASISMELVIGPDKHQPFDDDGSIPSNHLHNFEHAAISLALLVYAVLGVALDRLRAPLRDELTMLLAAAAFAQQLLMFHLHSGDHMGVEGQYHRLLQTVIAVSLATALLAVAHPRSFLISFVRSASIAFQGVWFVVMGFMLWTPGLISKGCFMNLEEGHRVVRCHTTEALDRAKSLVNLQFSWFMTAFVVFCVLFYLLVTRAYPEEPRYLPVVKEEGGSHDEEEEEMDLESQKLMESASFARMGTGLIRAMELER